jgi:hypothetical protein
VDLSFPVFIPSSAISVKIDDVAVHRCAVRASFAEDSLSWMVTFRKKLASGRHQMLIDAQGIQFHYDLVVSETAGLSNVINFRIRSRAPGHASSTPTRWRSPTARSTSTP